MNTLTLYITGDTQYLSGNNYYQETVAKGRTGMEFNFTGLDTSKNSILRAKINYGDGADIENIIYSPGFDHEVQPITYYFALYGSYSPILIKTHIYDPPDNSNYFNSLTASFHFELSNGKITNLFFPIKIAQPSYYDEVGNINIASTQLVSVSSSDVFCTVHNKAGNVHNIVLL
jgi:hypothetical protein